MRWRPMAAAHGRAIYSPMGSRAIRERRRWGCRLRAEARGYGGRAHAANEYWVIEGAGKVYGMGGRGEIDCG